MPGPAPQALPRTGIQRRMMAHFYDRMMADYEAWIESRKRDLFSGISGRVIELGPGQDTAMGEVELAAPDLGSPVGSDG